MDRQTQGYDSHGCEATIGEHDSDGVIVGFIDSDGLSWQSLRERDLALTAGRYQEAMIAWREGCGETILDGLVQVPNPWAIANQVCLDQANVGAAVREALAARRFIRKFHAAG